MVLQDTIWSWIKLKYTTLQWALQVDPEVVIWNRAWPIAGGGWNLFKAAICLKQQIISSLSHYESVITRAVNCHQPIGHKECKPISVAETLQDKHMITRQTLNLSAIWSIHSYATHRKTTNSLKWKERIFSVLWSGGRTPTYGLASSRHPHSFRKRKKKTLDWGQYCCLKCKMFRVQFNIHTEASGRLHAHG